MSKTPDTAAITAAIATLSEDDIGQDGIANMKPLNAALAKEGFDPIKAKDRDAALAEVATPDPEPEPATEPPLEEADLETVDLIVTRSMADPMPLYVHGVGSFTIRVGVQCTLPQEAVSALDASDCAYDIVKG